MPRIHGSCSSSDNSSIVVITGLQVLCHFYTLEDRTAVLDGGTTLILDMKAVPGNETDPGDKCECYVGDKIFLPTLAETSCSLLSDTRGEYRSRFTDSLQFNDTKSYVRGWGATH